MVASVTSDLIAYKEYAAGDLYKDVINLITKLTSLKTQKSTNDQKLLQNLIDLVKGLHAAFGNFSNGNIKSYRGLLGNLIDVGVARHGLKKSYTLNAQSNIITFKNDFYFSPVILRAFIHLKELLYANKDFAIALNFINPKNISFPFVLTHNGKDSTEFKFNAFGDDVDLAICINDFDDLYEQLLDFYLFELNSLKSSPNGEKRDIYKSNLDALKELLEYEVASIEQTDNELLTELPADNGSFAAKIARYKFVLQISTLSASKQFSELTSSFHKVKSVLDSAIELELKEELTSSESEKTANIVIPYHTRLSTTTINSLPKDPAISLYEEIRQMVQSEIDSLGAKIEKGEETNLDKINQYIQVLRETNVETLVELALHAESYTQLNKNELNYKEALKYLQEAKEFLSPTRTSSTSTDPSSVSVLSGGSEEKNQRFKSFVKSVLGGLGRNSETKPKLRSTFFDKLRHARNIITSENSLKEDDCDAESLESTAPDSEEYEDTVVSYIDNLEKILDIKKKEIHNSEQNIDELNANYIQVKDIQSITNLTSLILQDPSLQLFLVELEGTPNPRREKIELLPEAYLEHITFTYISQVQKYFNNLSEVNSTSLEENYARLAEIDKIINFLNEDVIKYAFVNDFINQMLSERYKIVKNVALINTNSDIKQTMQILKNKGFKIEKYVTITQNQDKSFQADRYTNKWCLNLECYGLFNKLKSRLLDVEHLKNKAGVKYQDVSFNSIKQSLVAKRKLLEQVNIIEQELLKIGKYIPVDELQAKLAIYLNEFINHEVNFDAFKHKFIAELHSIDYAAAKQDKRYYERSILTIIAAISLIGLLVMGASYAATYVTTGKAYLFWESTHKQDAQKNIEMTVCNLEDTNMVLD